MNGPNILIYLLLLALTIVNIVVPFSGAVTVTPLLAALTDTHRAIGIAAFYYFIGGGVIRAIFFWKDIRWEYVKRLLPGAVIGAVIGAFALIAISEVVVTVLLFGFVLYFLIQSIRAIWKTKNEEKKDGSYAKYSEGAIGILVGFLQGSGFSGSDLRNGYLYFRGLTVAEVHGVASVVGGFTFLAATLVRLGTHELTIPDLTIIMYLIPFLVIGTYVGKRIVHKLDRKYAQPISIFIMSLAFIAITIKLVNLLY
jgi:uncharacterized membrane protein YfcA